MLKKLETSLLDLETAFNSSKVDSVLEKTNFLSKEIELIKNKDQEAISIDNKELTRTTKLIEKLSIQNEYKLSLLKEFSTYALNKK
tara:strand:+ start:389 stop:646 length:258 start_codon:yes stop_codon:yes gene_type:complete